MRPKHTLLGVGICRFELLEQQIERHATEDVATKESEPQTDAA
jgi:hypothetical protein